MTTREIHPIQLFSLQPGEEGTGTLWLLDHRTAPRATVSPTSPDSWWGDSRKTTVLAWVPPRKQSYRTKACMQVVMLFPQSGDRAGKKAMQGTLLSNAGYIITVDHGAQGRQDPLRSHVEES